MAGLLTKPEVRSNGVSYMVQGKYRGKDKRTFFLHLSLRFKDEFQEISNEQFNLFNKFNHPVSKEEASRVADLVKDKLMRGIA